MKKDEAELEGLMMEVQETITNDGEKMWNHGPENENDALHNMHWITHEIEDKSEAWESSRVRQEASMESEIELVETESDEETKMQFK